MPSYRFQFAFIYLALLSFQTFAQTNPEIPELLPGQTLEREMTDTETHSYNIALKKDEFFQVRIEQRGVDVTLKLVDSKGSTLATMDSPNEDQKYETLSFAAGLAGNYILEVSRFDKDVPKGNYSIKREMSRTATIQDRKRVAVEKTFVEGLAARKIANQKETAIIKLEESLKGWQELNDTYLAELTSKEIKSLKESQNEEQTDEIDKRPLPINKAVEREIKSGDIHFYTIKLKRGQILKVNAVEKGMDITLQFARISDQEILGSADFGFGYMLETLTVIADSDGNYAVTIQASETASAGRYKISATLKKSATIKDEERIKAEKLLAEGMNLHEKSTEKDLNQAIIKYNESIEIWRRLGENYWVGFATNLLGTIYISLGYKQKALKYYNLSLPLRIKSGDLVGQAETLNNIGAVYDSTNKSAALSKYTQALRLYETVGDVSGQALTLNNVGLVYSDLGDKQKALEKYRQALQFLTETNDLNGQAQTLNYIGAVYFDIGKHELALQNYASALQFYKDADNLRGQATVLNNIGSVYEAQDETKLALEKYDEAFPLRIEVGDYIGQATTLNNIGSALSDLGNNSSALEKYGQALQIYEDLEDIGGQAIVLNNIGKIHADLGNTSLALEKYEKALQFYRKLGDFNGQALIFNNTGLIYANLDDDNPNISARALEKYKQALRLWIKTNDRAGQATALGNIGALYSDLEDSRQALIYLNKSLLLRRVSGERSGEAITLNNIGTLYFASGENTKALKYFNQALSLSEAVKDLRGEAAALDNLMGLWESQGAKDLAILYGKQSVNLYQQLRYFIEKESKGTQRIYLKSIEDTYRFLTELLLAENRRAEAIQVLEMLKKEEAFSFENVVDNQPDQLNQSSTLSPNEVAYLNKVKKYFDRISQPISDLAKLKQFQEQEIILTAEQKSEVEKLTVEVEKIEKEFDAKMQEFANEFNKSPAMGRTADIQLPIQKDLAKYGEDTVFLYTLVGEERYWVILITEKTLESRSFDIKRADLNDKIEIFRSELQNKRVDPRDTGKKLYDILINKPIGKELSQLKAKTLLWSLDGKLRLIPVAALWTGEKYFGQEYRNLNVTVSERSPLNKPVSREWNVLGAGTSETQNVKSDNKSKQFDGLKYVKDELTGIVKENEMESGILAGKRLYNVDFTLGALNKELGGKYKVIHFASHFSLNPGNIENSYLVLGDGNILTIKDIRNNENNNLLSTELLVLSACQTGVTGKDSNGIEIEGFAYIAQEKGAEAILSSLWKVADKSTSLFMKEFYRMRKEQPGLTKVEIIQKIQEKMIDGGIKGSDSSERTGDDKTTKLVTSKVFNANPEKPYEHPYFWAPFVLVGNWH